MSKKICRNKISDRHLMIINLIIHVFLAFIFLNLMFYFLIASTEEESLQRQIDSIVKAAIDPPELPIPPIPYSDSPVPSILDPISDGLKGILKEVLNDSIDNLKNKYDEPNVTKTLNNTWLNVVMIIGTIFLFSIPLCIFLTMKTFCSLSNARGTHILFHNFMIVLFVLSFEVYFIITIGLNYIPVDPVLFTKEIYDSVSEDLIHVLTE